MNSRISPAVLVVVNDNPIDQQLLTQFLKRLGIRVAAATDGMEALRLLQNPGSSVGLVILDLELPGMNGFALAAAIRADAQIGDLFLIGVTAHPYPAVVERAYAVGINGVMTKPYQPKELRRILSDLRLIA